MSWQKNDSRPINKNRNRRFSKNAAAIGVILSDAVSRHGIGWQVKAAMTVKKANEILDNLVEPEIRQDLRALSFTRDTLTIVCRHSAAANFGQSTKVQIQEMLETEMPDVTICEIIFRIDPHGLDSGSEIGV